MALGDAAVEVLADLTRFESDLESGIASAVERIDPPKLPVGLDNDAAAKSVRDFVQEVERGGAKAADAIEEQMRLVDIAIPESAFRELERIAAESAEDAVDLIEFEFNGAEFAVPKTAFNDIVMGARRAGEDAADALEGAADDIVIRVPQGSFDEVVVQGRGAGEDAAEGVATGFAAAGESLRGKIGEAASEVFSEYATRAVDAVREGLKQLTVEAVSAAADAGEALNVVGLVFDENTDQVTKFAEGAADALGVTEAASLSAAAAIGGQLQNLGFAEAEAAEFSTTLQTLGADLGSAFNTDPVEAIAAIQAAIRGENESIERLNVFLTAEKVNQEAVNLGLAKSTSTVNDYAKAKATLSLITQQTTAVEGDFAATASSLPNLLRRVTSTFGDLQAVVGEPALAELEPIIEDLRKVLVGGEDDFRAFGEGIAEFVRKAGPSFVQLVERGIDVLPELGSAFGGLGGQAGAVADAVGNLLPGIVSIVELVSELSPELIATAVQMLALNTAFGKGASGMGLFFAVAEPLTPVLSELVKLLDAIPAPLVAAGFQAGAVAKQLTGLSKAAEATAAANTLAGKGTGKFTKALAKMGPGPIAAIAVGVAALTAVMSAHGKAAKFAAEDQKAFEEAVKRAGDAIGPALGDPLVDVTDALYDFTAAQIEANEALTINQDFLGNTEVGLADALRDVGLTQESYNVLLEEGGTALEDYVAVQAEAKGLAGDAGIEFAAAGEALREFGDSIDAAAEAELDALVLTDQLTESQIEQFKSSNRLADGTIHWEGALLDAEDALAAVAAAEEEAAASQQRSIGLYEELVFATGDATEGLKSVGDALGFSTETMALTEAEIERFAFQVETGLVSSPEAAALALEELGVTSEQLPAVLEATTGKMEELNERIADSFGQVTGAIEDLNDDGKVTLNEALKGIEDEIEASRQRVEVLQTLYAAGLTGIAALVEEGSIDIGEFVDLNPAQLEAKFGEANAKISEGHATLNETAVEQGEVSAEIARQQNAEQKLLLAQNIEDLGASYDERFTVTREHGVEYTTLAGNISSDASDAFGDNLTTEGVDIWDESISSRINAIDIKSDTRRLGEAASDGLAAGLESGISKIGQIARRIAGEVERGIGNGLKVKSPSRVTREIGQFAGQGLIDGMESTVRDIRSAAAAAAAAVAEGVESGVGEASLMIDDVDVNVNANVNGGGGGGGGPSVGPGGPGGAVVVHAGADGATVTNGGDVTYNNRFEIVSATGDPEQLARKIDRRLARQAGGAG